jgi:hypothetical protein
VIFAENLYAGVLMQMSGCAAIAGVIVSRVFYIGFTR